MSKRIVLEVRDDISEKKTIFHMFSFKSLASGALVLVISVIVENKPMELCYRCYIQSFYHIFPNAYNIKIYRHIDRK